MHNQKRNKISRLIIISFVYCLSVFTTSSLANYVDKFTGQLNFNHHLYTLPGRGGLNIDVKVNYSSNVYESAIALNNKVQNEKAKSGWLGLGWSLSSSFITSAHKNTIDIDDDDYWLVFPGEKPKKLLPEYSTDEDTKFSIEGMPYWRIVRHIIEIGTSPDNYKIVSGWTITNPDGVKKIFGDKCAPPINESDTRNATRYTFAWESSWYVGQGYETSEVLYPFIWDLSAVVDQFGNQIKYSHEQIKEKLTNSTNSYTKASYIKKITNAQGDYVQITRKDKEEDVVHDPYQLQEEPDGFMEFYGSENIDKISFYNADQTLLREFLFCYEVIGNGKWKKEVMNMIIEKNSNEVFEKTVFEYYKDKNEIEKHDNVFFGNDTYNFGALKSIKNSNCGNISFEYKKKYAESSHKKFDTRHYNWNVSSNQKIAGGLYSGGLEYMVVRSIKDVYVYNWNGTKWKEMEIGDYGKGTDFGSCNSKHIYAGNNYFIITDGKTNHSYCYDMPDNPDDQIGNITDRIRVFNWNGSSWVETLNESMDNSGISQSLLGPNYFTIIRGGIGIADDYYWLREEWQKSTRNYEVDLSETNCYSKKNYRVQTEINWGGEEDLGCYLYMWNSKNKAFEEKLLSYSVSSGNGGFNTSLVCGENYLAYGTQDGEKSYRTAYEWDGDSWERTMNYTRVWSQQKGDALDISFYGSNDYFAMRYDARMKMRIFHRDGNGNWLSKVDEKVMGKRDRSLWTTQVDLNIGSDYLIAACPKIRRIWWTTLFGIGPLSYCTDNENVRMYYWNGEDWSKKNYGNFGYKKKGKDFLPGNNFAIAGVYGRTHVDPTDGDYIYSPLNTTPDFPVLTRGLSLVPDKSAAKIYHDNFSICSPDVVLSHNHNNPVDMDAQRALRKGQGTFSEDFYTYVVSKVVKNDGFSEKDENIIYEYDEENATFDTKTNTAMFNKVEVIRPENGKTINYRFNDCVKDDYSEQADLCDSYINFGIEDLDKLNGRLYKKEVYNENGELLGTKEYTYELYHDNLNWHPANYSIRLKTHENSFKGVRTINNILEYNNENGLPMLTQKTNSDGNKIIHKTVYAFNDNRYPEMGPGVNEKHMITAICENVVYDNIVNDNNVISANATTWKNENDSWVSDKSYVWKSELPNAYEDFWTSSTDWECSGVNVIYNSYGQLLERVASNGELHHCSIYGKNGTLLSAEIMNSEYFETAVFTCDYDENPGEDTFFDNDNMWLKGGSELRSEKVHFGKKSVFVEDADIGPNKKIAGISPEKDYIFSAWVYPVENCDDSKYICLNINKNPATALVPENKNFTQLKSGMEEGWQYIRMKIDRAYLKGMDPSLNDVDADNYLEISISGNNTSFYVDDIRFAPIDARITSKYYHPKYNKTIAIVDNIGDAKFWTYDNRGRIEQVLNNDKNIIAENEYHCAVCDESNLPSLSKLTYETAEEKKSLDLNDEDLTYSFTHKNSIEKIKITPEVASESFILEYRENGGQWVVIYCPCGSSFEHDLSEGTSTFEYKVVSSSMNSTVYKIVVSRMPNCWVYHEDATINNIKAQTHILKCDNSGKPYIVYQDHNDNNKLKSVQFYQGVWEPVGTSNGIISAGKASNIDFEIYNNTPYVTYRDNTEIGANRAAVKKFDGSEWIAVGSGAPVYGSPGMAQYIDIAISPTGVPYIAYLGNIQLESGFSGDISELRLIVKKFNGTSWELVGVTHPDIAVSEESAEDIQIDFSDAGILYASYIACDSDNDANIEDEDGMLIVMKYNGTSWEQVGDIISNIRGENYMKSFALIGETPYVAYAESEIKYEDGAYTSGGGDYIVRVKKYDESQSWLPPYREDVPSNYSHWIPVGDLNLFRISTEGCIQLSGYGSSLYLAFTTNYNDDRLTVIKYEGSEWSAVGNPAFAFSEKYQGRKNISVSNSENYIYTCFSNESYDGKLSAMSYNLLESCNDATLSNIAITNPADLEIFPEFRQYIINYSLTVENSVSEITLDVTPMSEGSNVEINGKNENTISLQEGINEVTIKVSDAANTVNNTYNLIVTREFSSFTALCDIELYDDEKENVLTFNNVFSPSDYHYTVTDNYNGEYVYLKPISNSNSKIYVNGDQVRSGSFSQPLHMTPGLNTISVKSVAPDNITSSIYTININCPVTSDLGLTGISINGNTIEEFDMQEFYYNYQVENTIDEVVITPTSNGTDISINGSPYLTDAFTINNGDNLFNIISMNPSGNSSVRYSVNIIKPHTDQLSLTNIEIKDDNTPTQNDIGLTPAFSGDIIHYDCAPLSNDIKAVFITPTTYDSDALIKVGDDNEPVASGTAVPVFLDNGINNINITVIPAIVDGENSENGIYTIEIIKEGIDQRPKPKLHLGDKKITFFENEGTVRIPVKISRFVSADVTLDYTVVEGSATEGEGNDFILPEGTLVFDECTDAQNIYVEILDDEEVEPDETFNIILSNPSPSELVELGVTYESIITIRDDDFPEVNFTSGNSEVYESVTGGEHAVELNLSQLPAEGKDVEVILSLHGTAIEDKDGQFTDDEDFRVDTRNVQFTHDGPLSKNITFTLNNESLHDNDKYVTIEIIQAVNGEKGDIVTHELKIIDDEKQTVVFVDAGADDGGNGNSWGTAFNDLQDGLDKAESYDRSEAEPVAVWVAAGTYYPSKMYEEDDDEEDYSQIDETTKTFKIPSNVHLYGYFNGSENNIDERTDIDIDNLDGDLVTTLSGDLDGKNSYNVVTIETEKSNVLIDGFVIEKGYATMQSGEAVTQEPRLSHGGGICNKSSDFEIRNCVIRDNFASLSGGGIYNHNNSCTNIVYNCRFYNNSIFCGKGGAYYDYMNIVKMKDCSFSGNCINIGGDTPNDQYYGNAIGKYKGEIEINNCIFSDNGGNNRVAMGGALGIEDALLYAFNCTFDNNVSGTDGGAVYGKFISSEKSRMVNCLITNNSMRNNGAGLYIKSGLIDVINCTFYNNWSFGFGYGGGIYGSEGVSVMNSIFYKNVGGGVPGVTIEFYNQIYDNSDYGDLIVKYSDVHDEYESGVYPGVGNINVVPFNYDGVIVTDFGSTTTPCIDSGDPDTQSNADDLGFIKNEEDIFIDIEFNPRFNGNVDMGAFESQ